jgi:membrane protease subunit (stomatin/prohibitin family)
MGIIDKLRGEFIDIIEWTEPSQNEVLAYRFPRYNNEIKMGAQLVVREGQSAVFVNEGKLADVFQPGTYTLNTQNMPILSTLKGWKYGFNSPFKAEVYFVAMRQWTDLKWGTQNPVIVRDPEFGAVRIRAFGTYAMHVADPGVFLRQLVATDPSFEAYEISNQLRNTIVSRFADVLGTAKLPILDMAGNYDKLSQLALEKIKLDLGSLGLALTLFYVENISLPEEVEAALDTRAKISAVGDLNQYTRYQTATAVGDAARNPSGAAGAGVGLGAGVAIGSQMIGQMGAAMGGAGGPPPLPNSTFYVAINGQQSGPHDLGSLTTLVQQGKVSRDSLVWRHGLSEWVAASSLPELTTVFSTAPPPLPPQ